MREITPETAAGYLRETGCVAEGKAVRVEALGWGVSNVVMRVEVEGEPPFVLKQSRERLRTAALWLSRLERIWTEVAALRFLGSILPEGVVPRVLFDDRDEYLFAMTSAPGDSVVWKERLLAGEADGETAARAGTILGAMHAGSAGRPELDAAFADTSLFDGLRLDPYYRTAARAHPDLAPRLEGLAAEALAPAERTFVHADFSPKNLLVHGGGLTVVDFETAHAGDPAFDLGFFLSHLLLKALRAAPEAGPYLDLTRRFWETYLARTGLARDADRVRRASGHAAGCALARVDGKSTVDYLDEPRRAAARRLARAALLDGPATWDDLLALTGREVASLARDVPAREV